MVFSQAFQACILPAVAIPVYFLLNKTSLMSQHKAKLGENLGVIAAILFSLITTYYAILEFF